MSPMLPLGSHIETLHVRVGLTTPNVHRGSERPGGAIRQSWVRTARLSAPATDQPARLAATQAVRWLEWGVRSYQRTLSGITQLLLAAQIVVSVRTPRPIGYVMALAGIAYIMQGVVVGAEGFSSNGTLPGWLAFVFDLAWMIRLVVVAWQRPRAVRPLAPAPAAGS